MLLLNRHPHGFSSPSQSHYTPGVVITLCGDETAPFFGFLGAVAALFFSCVSKTSSVSNVSPRSGTEAAHGTAKSGVVASMGVMRLVLVMNSIVPVVVAVVLGLACGLAGLLAGMVIGFVGDTGVRANAQPPNFLLG